MQIVVAGAGGFVGTEVVAQALTQGHQVFPLVREASRTAFDPENLATGRLVPLPLGADPDVYAQGFGLEPGARWILASGVNRGTDPRVLAAAHPELVADLLAAAEALDAERIVLLSCLGAAREGHWAASKRAAEARVQASGRPWAVLRAAPVYGPGDDWLDEVGAWMRRSPFIPRFLEEVRLQPLHVSDLALGLLAPAEGLLEAGGEVHTWGAVLEACAEAAGKALVGPRLGRETLDRLARLADRGWLEELIPFDSEALDRHAQGYPVGDNALPRLLGRDPRTLKDYLRTEWAFRAD